MDVLQWHACEMMWHWNIADNTSLYLKQWCQVFPWKLGDCLKDEWEWSYGRDLDVHDDAVISGSY